MSTPQDSTPLNPSRRGSGASLPLNDVEAEEYITWEHVVRDSGGDTGTIIARSDGDDDVRSTTSGWSDMLTPSSNEPTAGSQATAESRDHVLTTPLQIVDMLQISDEFGPVYENNIHIDSNGVSHSTDLKHFIPVYATKEGAERYAAMEGVSVKPAPEASAAVTALPTISRSDQSVVSDDVSDAGVIFTPTTSAAPSVYNDDDFLALDEKVLHIVRSHKEAEDQGSSIIPVRGLWIKLDGKNLSIGADRSSLEEIITSDGSFFHGIAIDEPSHVEKDVTYRWRGSYRSAPGTIVLEPEANSLDPYQVEKVTHAGITSRSWHPDPTFKNPKSFTVQGSEVWIWEKEKSHSPGDYQVMVFGQVYQ